MKRRPRRIQRKRTKGWRLPPGAICVTRPGPWGNPFRPLQPDDANSRRICVEVYRAALEYALGDGAMGHSVPTVRAQAASLRALRGHDLACWCPLPARGEPDYCHAAVLLDLCRRF